MIMGVAIGLASYYGGMVDTLFMRFVDILIAFLAWFC
jgi:ABC-type dipeptide/oligopeptide/nickel transport system permease subunit